MKVAVLYHPKTEQQGIAEDFARDYRARHHGSELELISLETVEGAELAKLYDIVRYPAILVTTDDGRLQKFWQDDIPLIDEVAAYASQ